MIIPAYNEARKIESVLRSLDKAIGSPDRVEILVVDAGGSDGTMAIAERVAGDMPHLDIRTNISARGGRGPTLIAGAEAARGDVLVSRTGFFLRALLCYDRDRHSCSDRRCRQK